MVATRLERSPRKRFWLLVAGVYEYYLTNYSTKSGLLHFSFMPKLFSLQ
jgi:hypothetical protein